MFIAKSENAAAKQALIALMLDTPIGGIISNKVISEISHGRRYIWIAAYKVANRTHGVVFDNVHGVGEKRLPAADFPKVGARRRAWVYRGVGRTRKELLNGQAKNNLDWQTHQSVNRELAVLGLLQEVAK